MIVLIFDVLFSATPFGQVPMLTVDDDFKLSQSLTIARFLAKRFGLCIKILKKILHKTFILHTCMEHKK